MKDTLVYESTGPTNPFGTGPYSARVEDIMWNYLATREGVKADKGSLYVTVSTRNELVKGTSKIASNAENRDRQNAGWQVLMAQHGR